MFPLQLCREASQLSLNKKSNTCAKTAVVFFVKWQVAPISGSESVQVLFFAGDSTLPDYRELPRYTTSISFVHVYALPGEYIYKAVVHDTLGDIENDMQSSTPTKSHTCS